MTGMNAHRLRIAAKVGLLNEAVAFVEAGMEGSGLTPNKQFAVNLALEEAFVNVCHHAYPDGNGEAELTCGLTENTFVLEISDSGVPFDLLSLPAPDLSTDVMERSIGGLGVHFIRTLTDSVSYRREKGRNILRMCFHCTGCDCTLQPRRMP